MEYVYNDGGRYAAGFKGAAEDCVVRAIAIATWDGVGALCHYYRKVYYELYDLVKKSSKIRSGPSPRNGVETKVARKYLASIGWKWVPIMKIGSGCTVHVKASELPKGKIIVRLSKHFAAIIDGVLCDTYDSSREETRCVYGYWAKE